MRRWCSSRDVDVVVVPLKKALLIKVEGLLKGVRRDALRERDFQTAPRLTVFVPRIEFFGVDARQRKQKRRIQIGPHGIAGEVRQLQAIPRSVELVICEGVAR